MLIGFPASHQVNLQVQPLTEHCGTPGEWQWLKSTKARDQQCNLDQFVGLSDVRQRVDVTGKALEVGISVQRVFLARKKLTLAADPVLSGIAVAETIKGMQDTGILASIKHYIGNEQEHFRQVTVSGPHMSK